MRNAIIKFCNVLKDNNYPKNLEKSNPTLIFFFFSTNYIYSSLKFGIFFDSSNRIPPDILTI